MPLTTLQHVLDLPECQPAIALQFAHRANRAHVTVVIVRHVAVGTFGLGEKAMAQIDADGFAA